MSAEDPVARFQTLTAEAVRRLRVERLRRWVLLSSCSSASLLAVWAAVAFVNPAFAHASPVALGVVMLVVGGVTLLAWLQPVSSSDAATGIDRERSLPDSAISAQELPATSSSDAWRKFQLEDTVRRAESAQVRKGRFDWSLLSAVASVILLGVIVMMQGATVPGPQATDPLLAEHAADLEEMFADWELAQEEQPDPELQKLLEEVQPLREMLATGELDQRQMFIELSKVEDRIAAMQDRMAKESLDAHAAELAESMEGVEGMEPLAAALRAQDYAKAQEVADQLQKELSKPGAKTPTGAEQAASRMESAAEKMRNEGQQSMAQGMQNLSQGAKQNNPSKMADGMKKVSQAMGQQQSKKNQQRNMAACRQQVGMCKECMGEGESMSRGLSLIPKLSMSKKNGKGAGSEIDLLREKPATDSLGTGTQEALTGVADGMGDSETETVRTTEAPSQRTVSVATADFAAYRKLSEEAIEDESLPLAHRMTIRRYFESIRPSSENAINEP